MLNSYWKITYRVFLKQKSHTLINLSGLSIGIACCLLILLFINHELSYDKYHEGAENIYRISANSDIGGSKRHWALVPSPSAVRLQESRSDVLSMTLLRSSSQAQRLITVEDTKFEKVEGILQADSSFFRVFSHQFIYGSPEKALSDPGTIVISQQAAQILFGSENALGRSLNISNIGDLIVSGVIENLPGNSHFRFDYLVAHDFAPSDFRNFWAKGYIKVRPDADIDQITREANKINKDVTSTTLSQNGVQLDLFLQKLTDIHLYSHLEYELAPNGDIKYVYIFSAIALFILIIASINFMNLSTAKSSKRAKEVGMKKIFGARKSQLVFQFLNDSIVLSVLALAIAVVMVLLLLPTFNQLTGKSFVSNDLFALNTFGGILGCAFITGFLGGSYPAFVLSAFKPIRVLKGNIVQGRGAASFRRLLVVLQFAISVILISATILVLKQLHFMKNSTLGYDVEQILILPIDSSLPVAKHYQLKQKMLNGSGVINATLSVRIPSQLGNVMVMRPQGKEPGNTKMLHTIIADHDFLPTYGLALAAGRDFSYDLVTDSVNFIINESAAKRLGWSQDEALGKKLYWPGNRPNSLPPSKPGEIIGVSKDAHMESLHNAISPAMIMIQSSNFNVLNFNFLSLRVNTSNIANTLASLGSLWKEDDLERSFDYFFLNQRFDEQYQYEERLSQVFTYFGILAIFIAGLGLFGLSSFTADQKMKEIGIRKVLGASISQILKILSWQFLKWVLLATIIAWPVAWWLMDRWLQSFAYRTNISLWIFLMAGALGILIAAFTISFQSIKSARLNPTSTLRSE